MIISSKVRASMKDMSYKVELTVDVNVVVVLGEIGYAVTWQQLPFM